MTCWRIFIAIKMKHIIKTLNFQKDFLVLIVVNKDILRILIENIVDIKSKTVRKINRYKSLI